MKFRHLRHADWSISPGKRWRADAERTENGWTVMSPRLVGDTNALVQEMFSTGGHSLFGFDFPIGLPKAYGKASGLTDFLTSLDGFGKNEWSDFFAPAEMPHHVSHHRPFYPLRSRAGSRRDHLVQGLGVVSFASLLRRCDHATETRPHPACPIFWTLGGNQVGKATISGWRDVIVPARQRGARIWPFDGGLSALADTTAPVIAETYPAEAYRHVGVVFKSGMSKRRQDDRRVAMAALPDWAARHRITFSPDLAMNIADGFGSRRDAEDAFDALIGLLGMIEVVDGRRPECPVNREAGEALEGWILGQAG